MGIRYAYQDGPNFYDCETKELLKSYPGMVIHDFDVEGGKQAAQKFRADFLNYELV